MEWREVAVGADRRGDNALECFDEREVIGFPGCGNEPPGILEDEAGGFGIGEDHRVIVRLSASRLPAARSR